MLLHRVESFKHRGDATDYYSTGHHHHDKIRKMGSKHIYEVEEMRAELIGECYIGFQKLLNEELKAFDIKDSVFFDTLKGAGTTPLSASQQVPSLMGSGKFNPPVTPGANTTTNAGMQKSKFAP